MISAVLGQADTTQDALLVAGIVSIAAGVLIFLVPRVLNYIVALYLVASGVLLVIEAT